MTYGPLKVMQERCMDLRSGRTECQRGVGVRRGEGWDACCSMCS